MQKLWVLMKTERKKKGNYYNIFLRKQNLQ